MNLRCIAIDDEPVALEIISNFCGRHGNMELKTYTNPIVGIEQVKRLKPDILFMDVEMGEINGVELSHELPVSTSLIFTTAYAQYAVDGFDLNAVDFLHKPFSYNRFNRAIQKAVDLKALQNMSNSPVFTDEYITVKIEYKNTNIHLKNILYIESMDNYVRFHLHAQHPLMSQLSMKKLQELLPDKKFIRIHKSFIVPIHRIASFTNKNITLYDGTTLPVGRLYLKDMSGVL